MKKIDIAVKLLDIPLIKYTVRRKLTGKIEKHRGDFILASQENLDCLINSAKTIAVGPRMCYHLYKKDLSYAIFLDELADALIRLQLISKVSGKPLELCNQSLKTCCLWKLEKAGFKIFRTPPDGQE